MTAPNAFTGAGLDRAGDARRRDPAWVEAQRTDPAARVLRAGSAGIRLEGDALALAPLAGAEGPEPPLLLGLDEAGPLWALDEDVPPPAQGVLAPLLAAGAGRGEPARAPEPGGGGRAVALRDAVGLLSQRDGGLVAYVAALLNWHRRHRFCAACGAPTEVAEAGLVRRCPACGAAHHPRTDPVVIMLVTDGERVLLGRQPSWPARRYSALAGFVEPGEALEEAVAREVREEAGVEIGAPRYIASQPWPFPASLMLGFVAPWVSGDPDPGEDELEDARWFSRGDVERAAAADSEGWGGGPDGEALLLPPRTAIARRLVEGWLAAPGR